MLRLKYFPFVVLQRFTVPTKELGRHTDADIMEIVYKELEAQEYEMLQRMESTIEFEGDHAGLYSNFRPFWSALQAIDYGSVILRHEGPKRKVVLRYQISVMVWPSIIMAIVFGFIFKQFSVGLLVFSFVSFASWLWTYFVYSITISGCLDKAIYNEHLKVK